MPRNEALFFIISKIYIYIYIYIYYMAPAVWYISYMLFLRIVTLCNDLRIYQDSFNTFCADLSTLRLRHSCVLVIHKGQAIGTQAFTTLWINFETTILPDASLDNDFDVIQMVNIPISHDGFINSKHLRKWFWLSSQLSCRGMGKL